MTGGTTAGAPTLHYGTDRQGSVTMLTTDAGAVASELVYDPYGEEVAHTGTDWYNPFRYTGTYFDTSTGLYQMGARYYGAGIGRFTQADPRPSSALEANRYAYVGCNPVNATDPTGLVSENCIANFGAFLSSVVADVGLAMLLVGFVPGIVLFVGGTILNAAFTVVSLRETFETEHSAWETAKIAVNTVLSLTPPIGTYISALNAANACLPEILPQ